MEKNREKYTKSPGKASYFSIFVGAFDTPRPIFREHPRTSHLFVCIFNLILSLRALTIFLHSGSKCHFVLRSPGITDHISNAIFLARVSKFYFIYTRISTRSAHFGKKPIAYVHTA